MKKRRGDKRDGKEEEGQGSEERGEGEGKGGNGERLYGSQFVSREGEKKMLTGISYKWGSRFRKFCNKVD